MAHLEIDYVLAVVQKFEFECSKGMMGKQTAQGWIFSVYSNNNEVTLGDKWYFSTGQGMVPQTDFLLLQIK